MRNGGVGDSSPNKGWEMPVWAEEPLPGTLDKDVCGNVLLPLPCHRVTSAFTQGQNREAAPGPRESFPATFVNTSPVHVCVRVCTYSCVYMSVMHLLVYSHICRNKRLTSNVFLNLLPLIF